MSELIDFAKSCIEVGIKVVPVQQDKSPVFGFRWKDDDPLPAMEEAFGVGLVCGGTFGLECIDFDPKVDDINEVFGQFYDQGNCKWLLEQKMIMIAFTKSAGYHIIIRSEHYGRNQKLAKTPYEDPMNPRKKYETFIETRGDEGYFCCAPTEGYSWVADDGAEPTMPWELVPISKEVRDDLIELAKSFNRYFETKTDRVYEAKTSNQNRRDDDRKPGEIYNDDPEAINEVKGLLQQAGWTEVSDGKWRRPGKDKGISATFGRVSVNGVLEENMFYNFSSNSGFEEKGYYPFTLFTELKHNGDYISAARELAERYELPNEYQGKVYPDAASIIGKQIESKEETIDEILQQLEQYRLDPLKKVQQPPTIMKFRQQGAGNNRLTEDVSVLHKGDISLLIGEQKSKKSMFGTMIGAAMLCNVLEDKIIGMLPPDKPRIAVFDTEQSEWYAWKAADRLYKLSNVHEFDFFGLRKCTVGERIRYIHHYILNQTDVGLVLIDGPVDLIKDPNDYKEALEIVQWQMELTAMTGTHIMNVLHQNRGNKEARGFIGLAFVQKSETVIKVTRNEDIQERSTVSAKDTRGRSFKSFEIEVDNEGVPHVVSEDQVTGSKDGIF